MFFEVVPTRPLSREELEDLWARLETLVNVPDLIGIVSTPYLTRSSREVIATVINDAFKSNDVESYTKALLVIREIVA